MSDLISVIVPVYNVENYLIECIESIINQTYKYLEIILVNDGSTDHSYSICLDYASKDNRIKVINQENQGLSSARNTGLKNSTGSLISFVDSDDFISENFIETLYLLHKKYDSDITEVASINYTDGKAPFSIKKKIKKFTPKQWITQTRQKKFLSVVVWNKLYKRNLFANVEFPIGKKFEDEATTYKLVYSANKVVRSYSILYAYRQRENSLIRSKFSVKDIEDRISIFEEKAVFFKKIDVSIYEFCVAKLLILLFSILDSNDYDNNIVISKINYYYNEIKSFNNVSLKYKMYIKYKYYNLLRCTSNK